MHQARQCQWRSETVVRCGLTPDIDARSVEVPLWMFDGAVCDVMVLSEAPTSSAAALRELKICCWQRAMPMLADRGNLSISSRLLQEMLMSRTARPSCQASQLTLFQQARPAPTWGTMPIESRTQVEQLLARMLYEYATRRYGSTPHAEARDE